ncbi:VOC family protein [Azospirillum sp. B506]|uniref:VOC family protein n=1 Tax=Azospirillum sp. B506 TaxID=137721 RepID=UPI000346E055|nr:VOC family protein [Azospirillum sp. B506]
MTIPHVVTWFEIPVTNLARAVRFYETVLTVQMVQEPCPSGMVMAVFPAEGTAVKGCLIQHEACKPSADGSTVYLNGGDDLSAPLARAEQAGARIVVPKTLISPEIGYFAQFIDSEGNRVGLYSMH